MKQSNEITSLFGQPSEKISPILKCGIFWWDFWLCVLIFYSVSPLQPGNIRVLLLHSHSPVPPPPPTKEKEQLDTPNKFTSTQPRVKPERKKEREKNGRGGATEVKCVLKMEGLPLAAQLHSHVCGWADVLREDGRAALWKSKMAAKLHIIKPNCIPNQRVSKPLSK